MATVVVIGAGLGGLPAAYELRHYLPSRDRVILISEHDDFTFIPGLIQVALGTKPLDEVQLDLTKLAQRHDLELIKGRVTRLDPTARNLTLVDPEGNLQALDFDYAAIATGASLAFDRVPGLGPHGGYTHSVCTADHAITAGKAWQDFVARLERGEQASLVVGAAPMAGCFGPAYEFLLMAEHQLRERGLRDRATLTYITPEPYVGHLGVSGLTNARELTAELLQRHNVHVIENATITSVEPNAVCLNDGQRIASDYAMILPSFRAAAFVRASVGMPGDTGFIPVRPDYRHPDYPAIYALGVTVQLAQPDVTPVPIGLPKSGEMTEAMGMAVAYNIARQLGALKGLPRQATLDALCFAEFGDTGIAYIAAPVVPDSKTGKRRYGYAARGPWIVWVKAAFENYFMLKMKWGVGVPWFEKLGLRILFGLSLVEPLTDWTGDDPVPAASPIDA